MKTPAEIVARLLALMPNAVVRVIQGDISSRLTQVLHNGLTVWFYDSVAGLPGVPNRLCIEVREGPEEPGKFKRVFKAYVNPEAPAGAEVKQCARGAWRDMLVAPTH